MGDKKILVVVDMQNDFIDGALGTKEAQMMVPAAAARIRACKEAGYTVIATLDTHGDDYMDTREGKFLPVPHCIRNTGGWHIRPEIRDALGDGALLVEKPTFGSVRLPQIIREKCGEEGPGAIELLGLCTDICVVSNALLLKAAFPEADFVIRADCCAGVTPEKHLAALETMRSCQIEIV
ncbi:MAG: cysteine hydrolase [Clostridia bacterium]|nr:cysteine hydrolase [Clostridia bacterium]